jgi:hypothetical protein
VAEPCFQNASSRRRLGASSRTIVVARVLASEGSRGEDIALMTIPPVAAPRSARRLAHAVRSVRNGTRESRDSPHGPIVAPGRFIMRIVHALPLVLGLALASSAFVACGSSQPAGYAPDGGGGGATASSGSSGGDGGASSSSGGGGHHDASDGSYGNLTGEAGGDDGSTGTLSPCDQAKADKNTIGCDYYAVDPDVIQEGQGACFAAYIANTSPQPVTIGLEYAGQTFDATKVSVIPSGDGKSITYQPLPNGQLPPGQVAIVFLSQSPNPIGSTGAVACPITPAITQTDSAAHGTTIGDAFHITTDQPVVAYDILPYGGGAAAMTSATLLIPTSAWDTNYVAVDAYSQSIIAAQANAQPSIDIVAMEDGTTVTILPPVDIQPGSGVAGGQAGTPQTYNLAKGQSLQITQPQELTGAPIQSNKPIGVWGAASCLNIDPNTCCCDSAHQEIPPVKALGNEYTLVRYRNRGDNGPEETPPWRIVGAVDGTTLTWQPSVPQGAPTSIGRGQMVQFLAAGPYVVTSQDAQHPFYVSAHMSGCETYFTPQDCRGDAEFVDVVPSAQWLAKYTFFTDPTYPETNLVVVRTKQNGAFADVSLDCAGKLTGWQPIDSADTYEYTRIDLVRHNFIQQGNCDNGRHEMESASPFGLTVWGWGSAETGGAYGIPQAPGFYTQAVSYAYPAGMNVAPINNVVVPPQ